MRAYICGFLGGYLVGVAIAWFCDGAITISFGDGHSYTWRNSAFKKDAQ